MAKCPVVSGGEEAGRPFVCGTYTGDADAANGQPQYQDVSLGFRPAFVVIWKGGISQFTSYNRSYYYGGAAMPGHPVKVGAVNAVEVTDSGFRVAYHVPTAGTIYTEIRVNAPDAVYFYIAFR